MFELIKREMISNKSTIIKALSTLLGLFIVGEMVSTVIVILAKADDYASMGLFLSLVFGGISLFMLMSSKFSQGFAFAIKMSVSRKNYIIGAIGATFIIYICFFLIIFLFDFIDKTYVKLIFKALPYEIDFIKAIQVKQIIIVSMGAVCINALIGAIMTRFGKKSLLFIVITMYTLFLGALKFRDVFRNQKIVEQYGFNVFDNPIPYIYGVFNVLPENLIYIIPLVVCLLCLFIAISMLEKQAVTN